METFICTKCNCVEIVALGYFWGTNRPDDYIWDKSNIAFKGMPLCSQHGPKKYKNGKPTIWGKWHKKINQHHFKELRKSDQKDLLNIFDILNRQYIYTKKNGNTVIGYSKVPKCSNCYYCTNQDNGIRLYFNGEQYGRDEVRQATSNLMNVSKSKVNVKKLVVAI